MKMKLLEGDEILCTYSEEEKELAKKLLKFLRSMPSFFIVEGQREEGKLYFLCSVWGADPLTSWRRENGVVMKGHTPEDDEWL